MEGGACLECVLGKSVVNELPGVVGAGRLKLVQRIGREVPRGRACVPGGCAW